jgi:hypothetical protein
MDLQHLLLFNRKLTWNLLHMGIPVVIGNNANIYFTLYRLIYSSGRLFDGNQLTGSIPSTLGLVQTLEVV